LLAEVDIARESIQRCVEATASANGRTVHLIHITSNPEMRNDPRLSDAYRQNAVALGRVRERDPQAQEELAFVRKLSLRGALRHAARLPGLLKAALHPPVGLFFDTDPAEVLFATDMGDVSQVVPAIHPFIGIGGMTAPHSLGFTAQANSAAAYQVMLDAIAGAAVAAAVGVKPVAAELGLTVSVIGTPGEELLGLKDPPAGHLVSGKIVLLEAGIFDGCMPC
jgi:metal-dependent amidase/aminoacylase/carboxypeptidase family protein